MKGSTTTVTEIIEDAIASYAKQDLDGSLQYFSEDIGFTNQATGKTGCWAFECSDKSGFRNALILINTEFEMLEYRLVELFVKDKRAETRQHVRSRNCEAGAMLDTQISDVWTVEDGKVTAIQ